MNKLGRIKHANEPAGHEAPHLHLWEAVKRWATFELLCPVFTVLRTLRYGK